MSVDFTPVLAAAHDAFGADTVTYSPPRSDDTYEVTSAQWEGQASSPELTQMGDSDTEHARCQILSDEMPTGMPAPAPNGTITRSGVTWSVLTVDPQGDIAYRMTLSRSLGSEVAPNYRRGR